MTPQEYLEKVLAKQTFAADSAELKALQDHRAKVEDILRKAFPKSALTIRYGGSKAKGTMIRDSYDLDIICYFNNDDTNAGDSLKDIFGNVQSALQKDYDVLPKRSALRLRSKEKDTLGLDFHIDVVPGRFTDDKKEDVYLYQASGEKERLKTTLQVHIDHVKNSGRVDEVRLMKLWNVRNGLSIKTFVLELLAIKILKGSSKNGLPESLKAVWQFMQDSPDKLTVEDPANPSGNDLSDMLNDTVQSRLQAAATRTLQAIETSGWEAVFGSVEEAKSVARVAAIGASAAAVSNPAKPWRRDP